MDLNFDILDTEFESYGDSMLNQEQINGIFKRLSIDKKLHVKNILLVDDGTFMRYVIKAILTENGYFVVCEAEDGVMALHQYKKYKPDLVIMNLTMPVLDGIGATSFIKDYDNDSSIIMLSGISNYRTVKESILAGACGFICGRFDINKFNRAINFPMFINKEA